MKIFDNYNTSTICKICKTNKEGRAVLIPKADSVKDGIEECEQVHLDCIDLQLILGDCQTTYYIVQAFPAKI
jgi:hypothetical protein